MITVMIADDHGIVRDGLGSLLDTFDDVTVVGCAANGAEAVTRAAVLRPDVVLMDLGMPELDGVEATRRIVAADAGARVVVLTSHAEHDRILAALDAGAVGYLLKDGPADELVRAIRAAARGEVPIDPKVAGVLLTRRSAPDPLDGLSPREVEVLALVRAGLPNKLIARRLEITERTVKGHLTTVFRRIGATDRTQAALWAERHGVRTPDDRDGHLTSIA